jgi:hypothetical protein
LDKHIRAARSFIPHSSEGTRPEAALAPPPPPLRLSRLKACRRRQAPQFRQPRTSKTSTNLFNSIKEAWALKRRAWLHAHKRKRNGINAKSLGGGSSNPKTKPESKRGKADPAPAPSFETGTEEVQVARGAVAVNELMHEGLMLCAPDTSVCRLCRKWFSPPAARDGRVCETDRKVHVDLLTHGVLFASHCTTPGNHEVTQRGTQKESGSSSECLGEVANAISDATRASFKEGQ